VRPLRFAFSTVALLLPGIYVAITSFHQELLPTALLISIAASRVGVPFPIYIEALLMEITFEVLREAGVRLPRPVGQAVSIVGGLVIGEAAVRAAIVSPLSVIVVAITGISSFSLPAYNLALGIRVARFIFGGLGATLGLYGIMLGMLVLLIHIISLRSFGVPYFAPLAPLNLAQLKDVMIRVPLWAIGQRPGSIPTVNRLRQKFFLKPRLPANNDQQRVNDEA
jgi:spore germination protein KA